ncbi:hypothetical protein ElyMa_004796200 [Elysia marginata]|uniref:Uncharacterized protein n=1 Tax=Elysia marginata TaxID=1093978 RepID=A0AAV4IHS0_9GAST|nr:hypothetical protein ElyMa_004796200 [Elysia marginata]
MRTLSVGLRPDFSFVNAWRDMSERTLRTAGNVQRKNSTSAVSLWVIPKHIHAGTEHFVWIQLILTTAYAIEDTRGPAALHA